MNCMSDNLSILINKNIDFIDIQNLKNKKVVLFGAGFEGQIAYEYFKSNDVKISYYCDNNKMKYNKILNGVKIISFDELQRLDNIVLFITIKTSVESVKQQMDKGNIEYFVFSEYIMRLDFEKNKQKYMYVYNELLCDEKSKEIYYNIIKSRIDGDLYPIQKFYDNNSFCSINKFKDTVDEYFVDAGAYVGDTLEKFIWNCTGRFKKIYAFEPGVRQFNSLNFRVDRLVKEWALDDSQIECINAGLGEKNEILPLFEDDQNLLTSNFICKNNSKKMNDVQIYSLDTYIGNNKVTMIKVDIEGFEMEMLKGARNIINTQKPKLAISIYHKYEDLFELPMHIKKINPSYKMAIRHHSTNLTETVLYCWID